MKEKDYLKNEASSLPSDYEIDNNDEMIMHHLERYLGNKKDRGNDREL